MSIENNKAVMKEAMARKVTYWNTLKILYPKMGVLARGAKM
jgi:hypothetical protein